MGAEESVVVPINNRQIRLVKRLGEGGYSFIFLGVDEMSGEEFAVKRIIAHDEMISRTKQEIKLMKSFGKHPNIVKISGASCRSITNPTVGHEFFMLLEYCPSNLDQVIKNKQIQNIQFTEATIINMFLQICSAVNHLHTKKPPVAHRDLKIENILIGRDKKLKLCDFGSCSTDSKSYSSFTDITKEEEKISRFTTSSYRAPEMVDLYQGYVINHKVDVWALGCILYTLLYFQLPFPEGSNLEILNAKPHFPKSTYSSSLINLLKKLFTVNPSDRPDLNSVIEILKTIKQAKTKNKNEDHQQIPKAELNLNFSQNKNINPMVNSIIETKVKSNIEFDLDRETFNSSSNSNHHTEDLMGLGDTNDKHLIEEKNININSVQEDFSIDLEDKWAVFDQ